MSNGRLIVIVGAGTIPEDALELMRARHIINTPTAGDIYVGPPPLVDITLRQEEPFPEIDYRPLREPKKRDWEQRQRKPRRRT